MGQAMTPQTDSKKRDVTRGESCSMFSREPSVREVLDDPVVQAVMAVDQVMRDDLVAMMSWAREPPSRCPICREISTQPAVHNLDPEPSARGGRSAPAGRVGCGRSAQSSFGNTLPRMATLLVRHAGSSRRPLYCTVSPAPRKIR
jgi:hypothetical protein